MRNNKKVVFAQIVDKTIQSCESPVLKSKKSRYFVSCKSSFGMLTQKQLEESVHKAQFQKVMCRMPTTEDNLSQTNITHLSCYTFSDLQAGSSNIIKNVTEFKQFLSLNLQKSYYLKIIFRASQHNFNVGSFHELCSDIENTLVVAQLANGNIVGGYTPLNWNQQYFQNKTHYKIDKSQQSFIFNLTTRQKYKLVKQPNNKAILCSNHLGPTFGGGYDFSIGNFANVKYSSSCDFPASYRMQTHSKDHKLNRRSFIGTNQQNFLIKQWQVFEVCIKQGEQNANKQNEIFDQSIQCKNQINKQMGSNQKSKNIWNNVVDFFVGKI